MEAVLTCCYKVASWQRELPLEGRLHGTLGHAAVKLPLQACCMPKNISICRKMRMGRGGSSEYRAVKNTLGALRT